MFYTRIDYILCALYEFYARNEAISSTHRPMILLMFNISSMAYNIGIMFAYVGLKVRIEEHK